MKEDMAKFKENDKIVFGKRKRNENLIDITIGKIYTVVGKKPDLYILDDVNECNYAAICVDTRSVPTKIVD